ncbi:Uncharacterised protein [uncultured archaeon]|nr:Uncharacterised protein [uncultured archaeon]
MIDRNSSRKSYAISSRKGQFFSYDAIVAGLMFAILLTILYVYWSSLRSTVFTQIDDMFRTSIEVSNLLLTTGNPTNWSTTDVKQIGITTGPNSLELDPNKVTNFKFMTDQDFESMRARLGAAPYMFYIAIGDGVTVGIPPAIEATGKVSITRPVVYGGNASNITVTIWSNFTSS